MVEAPKRAIKFAANEQYSGIYMNLFNESKMTQPLSILTGISAGCTEALAIVPFELVKVRMQDRNNVSHQLFLGRHGTPHPRPQPLDLFCRLASTRTRLTRF
jgi:hypothetical protein